MRTLDRYVLGKVATRFALLLAIFLGIIIGGLLGSFIGRGVPVDVLLPVLPTLVLIALPLALPLALASALLVALGAMNKAGEFQALAAAGVDPRRVILRLWPLVLGTALLFAVLLHLALPMALGNYRSLLPRLIEAALGPKIEDLEPIWDKGGVTAWAVGLEGRDLRHVYLRRMDAKGESAIYAPQASWKSTPRGMEFRLEDVRIISRTSDGRLTTADAPRWAVIPQIPLSDEREPDTMATHEVVRTLLDPRSRRDGDPATNRNPDHSRFNNSRLTLHLRTFLPLALIAYCLFAAGLALVFATAEVLPGVAIVVVVVTVATYPAIGYVKTDTIMPQIDPGILLWPFGLGLGGLGWWMLRSPARARELLTTPPWRWRFRRTSGKGTQP